MLLEFNEFAGIVDQEVMNLPAEFKQLLTDNGIAILCREEVPAPVKEDYPDKIVFGIFIGITHNRYTLIQPLEPARIELYHSSFELVCPDLNAIKEQIQRTVIHEIAHYFGFSESRIRELGY